MNIGLRGTYASTGPRSRQNACRRVVSVDQHEFNRNARRIQFLKEGRQQYAGVSGKISYTPQISKTCRDLRVDINGENHF